MTELTPVYDRRKSFYGKARIESTRRGVTLWSYDTPVMVWLDATDTFARASDQPESQTTSRHMVEFMRQFTGDPTITSKDVRALPGDDYLG